MIIWFRCYCTIKLLCPFSFFSVCMQEKSPSPALSLNIHIVASCYNQTIFSYKLDRNVQLDLWKRIIKSALTTVQMCNHIKRQKKKLKIKIPPRHFENFIQYSDFFFTNIKNQQTGKKNTKQKGKMNKTNKKMQKIKSLWFTLFSAILWYETGFVRAVFFVHKIF